MLGVQQDSKDILLELDKIVTSWNLVVSGGVLKLEPPNFQDLELESDTDRDCDTHSQDLERTPHKRLSASVWLTFFRYNPSQAVFPTPSSCDVKSLRY